MKEIVKSILANNGLMTLVISGISCMALLFIKPTVEKFTQRFYPTSKSIQVIREVQLIEVYLPIHRKFRKYIGQPSKKLELTECKELYIKAFVKANKYLVYMDEDIIDCIEELGRDIKKHAENPVRDRYKKTAVKLLRNINIQYLSLKSSLSYTTNTSFRSFRSLDKVEQFYRISFIVYFCALFSMVIELVLMQTATPDYIVLIVSMIVLFISGIIMLISVAISLIDLIKVLFRHFFSRN